MTILGGEGSSESVGDGGDGGDVRIYGICKRSNDE